MRRARKRSLRRCRPNTLHVRLWAALLLTLFSALLHAQSAKPTEYEVKAAYLYNFGKFVRWPEGAAAGSANTFFICVIGKDPFGKSLDATLEGASWKGKPVIAKRITSVDQAADCQVLFIPASEAEQWSQLQPTLQKLPILTVSDAPRFARRAGMIEFLLSENRVRFEVNLEAAEKAGLSLSSQLLKVAIRVRRTGEH